MDFLNLQESSADSYFRELMGRCTYELAMAALRASMDHMGSLKPPTVALGLNTISAPFKP